MSPDSLLDEVIADDLAAALAADTAARWRIDRGPKRPSVSVTRADGRPIAALLVTRRPATLAATIAETWSAGGTDADSALDGLVGDVLAGAARRGDVAVKWPLQAPSAAPERLGFIRMHGPHDPGDGTEPVAGYVKWLRPVEHRELSHYAQTSSFTCGAVTAILALGLRGSQGFAEAGDNRDRELDFWRRASNYPSCEPIGLAVALRESLDDALGTAPVEVFLDTEEPVLLESYTEAFDRSFRQELQANSLGKALRSDIPVRRERVTVDEIATRVRAGEVALLLIDLEPMTGFSVPHWVLAHGAADGVILIDDPWISAKRGETWVDAHLLPIATGDLDGMLAWGPDGYRGVVFISVPPR